MVLSIVYAIEFDNLTLQQLYDKITKSYDNNNFTQALRVSMEEIIAITIYELTNGDKPLVICNDKDVLSLTAYGRQVLAHSLRKSLEQAKSSLKKLTSVTMDAHELV